LRVHDIPLISQLLKLCAKVRSILINVSVTSNNNKL